MTKKQQSLLARIPLKKHDPDGVTIKMIMKRTGWKSAHAGKWMKDQIEAGVAEPAWFCEDGRWYKAIRQK